MSFPRTIVVEAPATTANLGPGFDVFGMALDSPREKVALTAVPGKEGVRIKIYGSSRNLIPTDPEKNTAGVVAQSMMREFSIRSGLTIKIKKEIPMGVGLGSSAASAVAVAYGLNHLFNLQLSHKELVNFSAKGEMASAGFEHADNVSAAIYGGFVIIKCYKPLDIIHLEAPPNLGVCVVIPKLQTQPKKTQKARAILPKAVPMEKFTHNIGHAAALAVGFARGDVKLIGSSMSDAVIEPARACMIPGYQTVKNAALKAGALGVAISGAGPSMIAIVNTHNNVAYPVMKAMKNGFKSVGVAAKAFYTQPGKGAALAEA
ncbi:MAG: homoserine kinase [Candidatus Bathyarchaeia archaeon]